MVTDRLTGLALSGVVVVILAVGLAEGQDDWHAALVVVGALLQVGAILYATKRIWLGLWRSPQAPGPEPSMVAEGNRWLAPDDALVAGAMAIAGIVLTAVGNLV
jgi:hypothetical protein